MGDDTNGFVKWASFRWIFSGVCGVFLLGLMTLTGYVIANDAKRECNKDMIAAKLDQFNQTLINKIDTVINTTSDIKANVAAYGKQIEVNGKRLDKIEDKVFK